MSVKQLIEHHLEFLSLKGGCTYSSESTIDKMPHCWKSRVMAQFKEVGCYRIYVEIQWLKHLLNHEILFEIRVVGAVESSSNALAFVTRLQNG